MSHTIQAPRQRDRILAYMRKGRTLTPIEALEKFGTLRLSGRILELRQEGYQIKSRLVDIGGKRVARYLLVQ
jgi:hypothetical protein